MKIYLSISFLLIVTKLFGQADDEIIDFQKLTGFDSILVFDESGKLSHVYNYKDNVLLRKRGFYEGDLTKIINYRTSHEARIIQTYTKWVSYSEDMKQVEKVWGNTYRVDVLTIQKDVTIQKEHYESTGVDSTLQERIIPSYDESGRLVTKEFMLTQRDCVMSLSLTLLSLTKAIIKQRH